MHIARNIHGIKVPFHIMDTSGMKVSRFVYVYMIYGKKITLIDSGVAQSGAMILDYLKITGRRPDEISALILTHSHPDHIGGARAIKRASRCTVAAHVSEIPWIEDVELQQRVRPVPNFHSLVEGPVEVDLALDDGYVIDLEGGPSLEVVHTPGHSKGSISLFLREVGALFSGDAIPMVRDLPIYEDPVASVKSIKKLLAIEGIDLLLQSWDDPRKGREAYQLMEAGLRHLARIHEAVLRADAYDIDVESIEGSMELCRLVFRALGLPEAAANPLVARSFVANWKLRDHQNLLEE